MASDYFYNPLAHDEQIIAEKLGIYDYSVKPENDVNVNLKLALLQEELNNSKKQLQKQDSFISRGCSCNKSNDAKMPSDAKLTANDNDTLNFNDKKILLFLVIILAVICVVQYFSHNNDTKELLDIMCAIMQRGQAPERVPLSNPLPIENERVHISNP